MLAAGFSGIDGPTRAAAAVFWIDVVTFVVIASIVRLAPLVPAARASATCGRAPLGRVLRQLRSWTAPTDSVAPR